VVIDLGPIAHLGDAWLIAGFLAGTGIISFIVTFVLNMLQRSADD